MEFIPFNLSKKLKEKGFKQKCLAYYDVEDNVGLLYNTQYTDEALPCQYTDLLQCHNTGEAETQPDDSGFCVDAPTISQVLKWLRKEKGIHIWIDIDGDGWYFNITSFYKKYSGLYECTWSYLASTGTPNYDSYEQAALAGIKYCLDNLI